MLKNFYKIFVLVVLTEKYYMLMVYQYKRRTRRPILSAVSELLRHKMQDYTALFGTDAFYCNGCNHLEKRVCVLLLAISRPSHLIMPTPGSHLSGAPITLAPPHIVGAGTTICSWPIILEAHAR